ncbi:MAG TPA: heme exporter protein CcmB [Acidimicrobiales bacterium]|jgi:heme exporter protein B|nr:heme exporter protein CcmB [Acidimicrobiales bacterium]
MWRDALLVAAKDLRVEWRSRVARNQLVPFALAVLLLFGLALGPDRALLQSSAAGLFWVAVLLATLLAVQRSFAIESADDARDGLRLSGLDPGGIFVGKAAAIAVELVCLEAVLGVGASVLFDVHLGAALALGATCLLATAALASLGTVHGVVTAGARARETLLPLLFLPVVAPVLIAAVKASRAALDGHPGAAAGWLDLLGVLALVYGALGTVAFGPLLEDQ